MVWRAVSSSKHHKSKPTFLFPLSPSGGRAEAWWHHNPTCFMPCPLTPRRGGSGATLPGVSPGASAHLSWAASLPGSLKMVPVMTNLPSQPLGAPRGGLSAQTRLQPAQTPAWKTSSRVLSQCSHRRDTSRTRHHVCAVKCRILAVLPTGRDALLHSLQPSYPPNRWQCPKSKQEGLCSKKRLS